MSRLINQIRKHKHGAATVEAVISFTGFIFVIFTLLNLVNFCRAQMLISNAVDTVTKEITQYSYFYNISGLQKIDGEVQALGNEGAMNLNGVADTVGKLYASVGNAVDTTSTEATNLANSLSDPTNSLNSSKLNTAINNVNAQGTNIMTSINNMESAFDNVGDNPVLYMKSIIAVVSEQGLDLVKSHVIAAPLAKSMIIKHFGKNRIEADEELKKLGVVDGLNGLNFGMSTLFKRGAENDVHIVCYYKLKLLPIFEWAELETVICKESVAHAWLGGDDIVKKAQNTPSSTSTSPEGGDASEEMPSSEETAEENEDEGEESTGENGNEEDSGGDEADLVAAAIDSRKRAMIDKYGEEAVNIAIDGMAYQIWSEDEWEYYVKQTVNAIATRDELKRKMIAEFGDAALVEKASEGMNTLLWTEDDWRYQISLLQKMENKTLSDEDRAKIDKWKYRPSDSLYLQNKEVYDNEKYFNQENGDTLWPDPDGFLDGKFETKMVSDIVIDRYGGDDGTFFGSVGDSIQERALAPYTDYSQYNKYKVVKSIPMQVGTVAPWFDQPGGGTQYMIQKEFVENMKNKYPGEQLIQALIREGYLEKVP